MSAQLQVTGEAKIRDLQGPVVANSGVITALDGLPSQYVRGDGTLADIPSVTGGGASVSYYLNGSVNQGTFGGSTYYQLGENAITGVGTNFSTSTDGLLAQFITDIDVPDQTEIPSGNWNIEFYMGVSASSGALASFYVEIYKYDGTTFTLVGTNVATPEFLTNTTTVDAYFTSVAMPFTVLAQTDRIAIRIYASVAGKTVTMYTEDNRLCQVVTTFSRGMLSLNSLTDQQQYLTVGTAGTDFNIVSALDTHTFNIPSASATNRGLITTGTQTIAGAKTFSSTATFNTGGVFNNWGISLYDGAGSTALSSSTLTGIYASKSGSITDIVISHNAPYDSILRFSNDVANFTYTFPDESGTIALLEANQNITGFKQFSDAAGTWLDYGFSLVKGNTPSSLSSSKVSVYSNSGDKNLVIADTFSSFAKLQFQSTGNLTYTFPALSGTIALLEGSQTFTGEKVFNNNALFNSVLSVNYGAWLQKGTPTATFSSAFTTLYSEVGAINAVFRDNTNQAKLQFQAASNYTYTFPASSGTVALTSNLSSYVPYTGATSDVNLGMFSITTTSTSNAQIFNANGSAGSAGQISMKWGTGFSAATGYSTLGGFNNGFLLISNIAGNQKFGIFDLSTLTTSVQRTYTLPDASGTLALTSNLSAYVPYTGATGPVDLGSYDLLVNGVRAGKGGGTGSNNTRFGALAFMANTTGSYNAALGTLTLNANTTGANNTAIGNAALQLNTTGGSNTSVGAFTLTNNTTGVGNIALGTGSLAGITTGSYNIAIGINTANLITTGDFNTIIGNYSGSTNLTSNIILADGAGNVRYQWNGTNNVFGNAVQASAYRLTGMTAGSGALYWTSDRVTLANYNASGILTFEVNGGATALTLTSTGAATFSNTITAANRITCGTGAFRTGGFYIPYSGGGAASRTWAMTNDEIAFGDFSILTSTTQTGDVNLYRLYINPSGNVGIGTTSPTEILHLNSSATNAAFIRFQNTGGSGVYIGGRNDNMELYAGGSERMRITSGGNVLIGTTTLGSGTGVSDLLTIGKSGSSSTGINFTDGTSNRWGFIYINNSKTVYGSFADTTFETGPSATERMRITSGGDVAINSTDSSGYKFKVAGGGSYSVLIDQTGGTAGFIPLNINHNVTSGTIRLINFSVGTSTDVGSITTNGSTTSFNTSSDYRLKQDLKDYNALNLISSIKTYDYQWKNDKSRMHGVIAHELAEVLPYAVINEKDGVKEDGTIIPQGVDYSKIVPVLVKAIQEQQAQIEELKALIAAK